MKQLRQVYCDPISDDVIIPYTYLVEILEGIRKSIVLKDSRFHAVHLPEGKVIDKITFKEDYENNSRKND